MQPVDATSSLRSISTARVMEPADSAVQTDKIVETIPIVEPRPHYPLSSNVSEMMAHITELIEEQQTASKEAMHEKNLENARAEMARLFDAARQPSDVDPSTSQVNARQATVSTTQSGDSEYSSDDQEPSKDQQTFGSVKDTGRPNLKDGSLPPIVSTDNRDGDSNKAESPKQTTLPTSGDAEVEALEPALLSTRKG
ncbi:hypothetical protein [Bartonella sp. LJL80]